MLHPPEPTVQQHQRGERQRDTCNQAKDERSEPNRIAVLLFFKQD
jgi:hypothetical protein